MDQETKIKIQRRKTTLIWSTVVICIIFLFIFSMFHLQQRGEYKMDETIVSYNDPYAFYTGSSTPGNVSSSSESEVKTLLPQLQLDYDNAKVNGDFANIQQSGMTLAMAYLKLHDRRQARNLLDELKQQFSYDTQFVAQCDKVLNLIK